MKRQLFPIILFLVTALLLSGCNTNGGKEVSGTTGETKNIGEGNTVFSFQVVDQHNISTEFVIHTDETYIGAALLENNLIEGEDSAYGLFVKSVNGITADYDADQAYWSFYVDGEYALTGVDMTKIEKDKQYAFIYTKE